MSSTCGAQKRLERKAPQREHASCSEWDPNHLCVVQMPLQTVKLEELGADVVKSGVHAELRDATLEFPAMILLCE